VNPKPQKADLRRAYGAIIRSVGPNDLLLEASTPKSGGPVGWYFYYDRYYLRPEALPSVISKGSLEKEDFQRKLGDYKKMSGRLWVMITLSPSEEGQIRAASDKGHIIIDSCYEQICVLRSNSAAGTPMRDQLKVFFVDYSALAFGQFGMDQATFDAMF
jgi:hypothetical protein